MKINLLLLIIVLTGLTITTSVAQQTDKGLYVKIYGGPTVFTPGSDQLFTSPGYFYNPGNNGVVALNSNGRYGAGLNVGVEIQKETGKLIMVGLTVNYLSGKQLKADGTVLPQYTLTYTYTQTGKLSVLSAIPNIGFKIFSTPSYYIYTKLGIIVAVDTKYSSSGNTNYSNLNIIDIYSDQWKYGLNIGVQAAAGVQFTITGKLNGFAEISDNFLSLAANSYTYKQYRTTRSNTVTSIENIDATFIKSNSGYEKGSNTSATNGFVTTLNYTVSQPAIYQHANSTVLNLGVAFAIK